MVPHGSTLTLTVKGTTGAFLPRWTDSVRQVAIDHLTPFFNVQSVGIATKSVVEDPFHSLSNWPYTATVRIVTREDYGDIRDVDSIVAHAFYEAGGELPTVTTDQWETPQAENTQTGISLTGALVAVAVILALVLAVKLT